MRQLYLTFKNIGAVSQQLTWTHYRYILSLENESRRNYYINISLKHNLSVRQLREKIKNKEYETLEYKNNIELITDDSEMSIKDILKKLSKKLTNEFGSGFSLSGLYNMRLFYNRYKNFQPLAGNLSWSHYCYLIYIEDDNERSFYEKECIKNGQKEN